MKEFMYDINSLLIALILFISLLSVIELGYRFGKRSKSTTESCKSHINTIQSSLLGVLALLLGFTFSLSLQRYDNRSVAVVDEANAIGTGYLRAQLLPEPFKANSQKLLLEYLSLRVQASQINLANQVELEILIKQAKILQGQLWQVATQAAQSAPGPVSSGLYIQALNDIIDSLESRISALNRHVPEPVLLLLYVTFLMAGSIVGYASGVGGHRTSYVTYILIGLIVLLVFIIIDLDRPRRGLIEVNQQSLSNLLREAQTSSEATFK